MGGAPLERKEAPLKGGTGEPAAGNPGAEGQVQEPGAATELGFVVWAGGLSPQMCHAAARRPLSEREPRSWGRKPCPATTRVQGARVRGSDPRLPPLVPSPWSSGTFL